MLNPIILLKSAVAYITSIKYIAIILIILLLYILLKKGLKTMSEAHTGGAVSIIFLILGSALLYFHYYIYGILAILVFVTTIYYAWEREYLLFKKEQKKQEKYTKYANKYNKGKGDK